MIYWQLFLVFAYSNLIGFGGGPAIIPIIHHDVVEKYGWMSEQHFSESLALGNALPGPIATKMAAYVGYEQAGVIGATIAVIGAIGPTMLMMFLLVRLIMKYKHHQRVQRLTAFVLPAVTILMAQLTWQFFHSSYESIGLVWTIGLCFISYVMMEIKKVQPMFVIIVALLAGGFLFA